MGGGLGAFLESEPKDGDGKIRSVYGLHRRGASGV